VARVHARVLRAVLAVGEEHARIPLAAASHDAVEVGGVRCVELDGNFGAGRGFVARERRSGSGEESRVRLRGAEGRFGVVGAALKSGMRRPASRGAAGSGIAACGAVTRAA